MKTLPILVGNRLNAHFVEHVVFDSNGFYTVTKPLHVFKKLYRGRIAYLIIPVGATVFAPSTAWLAMSSTGCRKMRASEAYVHAIYSVRSKKNFFSGEAIYRLADKHGNPIRTPYIVGRLVKPYDSFSYAHEQCASGIHFFLNVQDALNW